ADRAGAPRKLIDADLAAEQADQIAAARCVIGEVRHIDGDQVHRHAPGERTTLARDDRVGAGPAIARTRGAQKTVGITDRDDGEARGALRGPGCAVAHGCALLDRTEL